MTKESKNERCCYHDLHRELDLSEGKQVVQRRPHSLVQDHLNPVVRRGQEASRRSEMMPDAVPDHITVVIDGKYVT